MDTQTNQLISDYIKAIALENANLVKAYLFGSYATFRDHPDSDIDIALVFKNLQPGNERFDLQVHLMLVASKFDTRIEPHPISSQNFNANNPFSAEIMKTGIEINLKAPNQWQTELEKAA